MLKVKRSFWCVLLCLALALSACAPAVQENAPTPSAAAPAQGTPALPSPAAAPQYTPGSYTSTALGRNDDVTVECVFTENAIASIEVLFHAETAGVGNIPMEQLPAQIVENQSLGVDIVTGATLSSYALLNAVKDCVEQAGGDVKALEAVEVADEITEPVEKTADIIVVGAGGAGMAASLAAAGQGASVILIETNGLVGGNTLVSGMGWNAVDPDANQNIESKEGQFALLQEFLDMDEADVEDYAPILSTLKKQIQEYLAGDTSRLFDSVELHIMQFWTGCRRQGLDGTWIKPDLELVKEFAYNSLDGIKWLQSYGIEFKDSISTVAGGLWQRGHTFKDKVGAFAIMEDNIKKLGGELMLNTHADKLIYENGRVCGVIATYKDGIPVTLHANKAVILTSGGFGGNKEMADEYNNYWPAGLLNVATDQVASTQGDGITMALAVGADTEGMGYTQLFPAVNTVTNDTGPLQGFDTINAIYINKNGERFVNEYAERDVMSKAVLEQPEALHFQICDDTVEQARLEAGKGPSWEKLLKFVERGAFCIAETIEDAAAFIGCDVETLQATLDNYNQAVDNAYDPLTGRTVFGDKCDTPPYYISPVHCAIHNTMGGLKINTENAVLSTDGEAIPGLYAAGEVTGGLHAGNRLGGNAVGDAFVMGRNAGLNAAAQ